GSQGRCGFARHSADRGDHLGSIFVPEAAEMETGEVFEFAFTIHQLSEGFARVGKISPTMPDTRLPRIGDATQWTIRRDHALRKPVVPRLRAKEIAETHNQRAHSLPGGIFHPLFQLNTNS